MNSSNKRKYIVYIDMDDTIFDFIGHWEKVKIEFPELDYPQSVQGFFEALIPLPNAIESVNYLRSLPELEVLILTAPSVMNPFCYTDKRLSIEKHFDLDFAHNLILSPRKDLNKGDFLIDDNIEGKGQNKFEGKVIHFGSRKFPDWPTIVDFFKNLIKEHSNGT